MTPQRWRATGAYLNEVFGRVDAGSQLATLMDRAVEAGLPDIAVDASVGRLLRLLAGLTNGGAGARLAVEVGTLAGCSALWIAQGLAPGGRLITIELEPAHANFAQREFAAAGVANRVEIRRGAALDVLPALSRELGERSVDFAFVDAVKTEYGAYFDILAPMLAPGGLLVADNVLGGGSWWIDEPPGADESRDAIDAFNRRLARDERFEVACVPIREGVLIAHRR